MEFYTWNQDTAGKTFVWDTCKVYFRGQIMAFKAHRVKERNQVRTEIITKIHELEVDMKRVLEREKAEDLHRAYDVLKLVDADKIAQELLYAEQTIFDP